MTQTVHLVEPGGQGGVFQHAIALADALATAGHVVVLHTATDLEVRPSLAVEVCPCVNWYRERPPDRLRQVLCLVGYLRTLAHLWGAVRPGDVLHFEGGYRPPLTNLTLHLGRWRKAKVVYSPHNTFKRHGRPSRVAERSLGYADEVIVFSKADVDVVVRAGGKAIVSPLIMWQPAVDGAAVGKWRVRWGSGAGRRVVLFAGQVREDKRLDLLITSAAIWKGPSDVLAVVGEDKGAGGRMVRLARELEVEVDWNLAYVPVDEFYAAVAAADVVVCPYDRASQSAILSAARLVGTTSVASDVGGLRELADITVAPGDSNCVGRGILEAFTGKARSVDPPLDAAIAAHEEAYASQVG